uniref:Putative conserved plasma membrane protein n=1 Tax=Lutzomyia longipalpis TaxID=7200 RepID=A0A7G3ACK5_LUTLO
MPSRRFFTSLMSATFCFSSNFISFTLKAVCTVLGAASSSSSSLGAAAIPTPAIGMNDASGRLSFLFSNPLSSDTSRRLRDAISLTIFTSLGFSGASVPSGGGIFSFSPVTAAPVAAVLFMRHLWVRLRQFE